MKSAYRDDETLGFQILKTSRDHSKNPKIEVGELSHEYGKGYMRELSDLIEKHNHIKKPYHIQVFCTKERAFGYRNVLIFRFVARWSEPYMHPEQDLWYVDNRKNKVKLLWSLPQEEVFDFLLENIEVDTDLKRWILQYKKLKKRLQ